MEQADSPVIRLAAFLVLLFFSPRQHMYLQPDHYLTIYFCDNGGGHYILRKGLSWLLLFAVPLLCFPFASHYIGFAPDQGASVLSFP